MIDLEMINTRNAIWDCLHEVELGSVNSNPRRISRGCCSVSIDVRV